MCTHDKNYSVTYYAKWQDKHSQLFQTLFLHYENFWQFGTDGVLFC